MWHTTVPSLGLQIWIFSIKEVNPCCFSNFKSFTVPLQQHVWSLENIQWAATNQGVNFESLDLWLQRFVWNSDRKGDFMASCLAAEMHGKCNIAHFSRSGVSRVPVFQVIWCAFKVIKTALDPQHSKGKQTVKDLSWGVSSGRAKQLGVWVLL